MMAKHKKGQVLLYGLIIGLIAAIIVSYVSSAKAQREFNTIGDISLSLIGSSKEAEKALFYIDQSAKYASYQTIYDLGQKGGFEASDCGSYFGYTLWVNKDNGGSIKKCYPEEESIEKNFVPIFNRNLNQYTTQYLDAIIPMNNYEISLMEDNDGLKIIGNAKYNLEFNIERESDDSDIIMAETKKTEELKRIYGSSEKEVKSQLEPVEFAGKTISVHKKAAPAFEKVSEGISGCEAAKEYDFYSLGTFTWRSIRDGNSLSLHSFGIAIDINPPDNPMCPGFDPKNLCPRSNTLVTDIPPCVINAFTDNGFEWGGAWKTKKDAMHFEYLGDPYDGLSQEEGIA